MLGAEPLALEDLHDRGDFPYAGDGQLLQGHELLGIELLTHVSLDRGLIEVEVFGEMATSHIDLISKQAY